MLTRRCEPRLICPGHDHEDNMSRDAKKKKSTGVPTQSDTNWPVHLQKMARSLKFRI